MPRALIERVDLSFVSFVRFSALTAGAFISLHKLNWDFLNPEVSCLNLVTDRLSAWRDVGRIAAEVTQPWLVVLSEAAIPVLLWFRPRWGILYTVLLLGTLRLANFGPIAIVRLDRVRT